MNCHDAQTCLHGYLDGELDPLMALQYEQHLDECPTCAKGLAAQKALQTEMKADTLYYKASDRLRRRVQSALAQSSRHRGHSWLLLGAAASLLLCIGLGLVMSRLLFSPAKHDLLAQEVVAGHNRSLQLDQRRLVDIPSSDRHEVKPWFEGKLDFAPPVADLAKQGFPLIGGRLDYLDGRPVAALVYQRRKHVINVFVWPDAANKDAPLRSETRQGYHVLSRTNTGMNWWIVSDLDAAELSEFARLLEK
jgi:anti-sigma factor RsiW